MRRLLCFLLALGSPALLLPGAELLTAPVPADQRVATIQLQVAPQRPDWTYQVGDRVVFRVQVRADQHPLAAVPIRYRVGPEMLDAEEREAVVPQEGLEIDGGTLTQPGFIRCIVTTQVGGRSYRAVATAGFAPEQIRPTQTDPADFEAFWNAGKALLAAVPLDIRTQLIPEASTGSLNVYHVGIRTWSPNGSDQMPARIYGILCEPKAPGRYPVILRVPGAGVRPYTGLRDLAERGAITLEIGIHGLPVNLPAEVYDHLRSGALGGYTSYNLDNRDTYYYRRVYLGCVRAVDFLTTRENWDGRNVVVMGGSQGGQLAVVTGALDHRVTAVSSAFPAYSDVTGYLHGRAGGWPHLLRDPSAGHRTELKLQTSQYYDTVNFARRLKVPVHFSWGYNDEVCPPTSLYSVYNVVTAPKTLTLALEMGHTPTPEVSEQIFAWLRQQAGMK